MGDAVMKTVCDRLKELRISAVPTLSIRRMADELGISHTRYVYFEDPKRFKKAALPIDLTRQIAVVLQKYGVDPAEVMKLAGLSEVEAEPEGQQIEKAKPTAQYVSVSMLFPSEAALTDMFESLLAIVPKDATRYEAAQILARLLPAGFAAIGPVAPDNGVNLPPMPLAPNAFAQAPDEQAPESHS